MKPLFIISCPIDTYSGYGARSRDVVKSLIELNKYDIKVLPQKWGSTPWGFIKENPEWEFLIPYLLPPTNQLPAKPKIWMQITIPNEFQPVGEYNIGLTAGIETTICNPTWIEGLNRMDLNLVSSQHAKKVFTDSKFTQQNEAGVTIGEIALHKPIEVLFEGVDLNTFYPSKETNNFNLDEVTENFAYLFVGHWMTGHLGEDRKNVGLLIKSFYETFKNRLNSPALILKTSASGASYLDRDFILNKIQQVRSTIKANTLPNVYLLHGEFTDKEVNKLYNHKKIKAMVSLTKGEGFGRPLLEFSAVKKPIIASNWSGQTDFLDPRFTTLITGELDKVHESAANDWVIKESQWFKPNILEFNQHLIKMFENYKIYEKGTNLQYHKSKNNFSFIKMKELLENILNSNLPNFPEEIKLNLPKLNTPKLTLPKLQK